MADLQALIDAGMSPLDAASLAADLQRYETTGAPQLPFGLGGLGPAAVDAANYDYQTFTAPLSNKGNPTATFGNITNTFGLAPDQQIRLVDDTGKVIYSGTGYDAANEAIKLAQGLTDAGGKKAAWEIQTTPSATQTMWGAASPQDGWKTIAQENKNKSPLGAIADIALPVIGGMINPFLGAAMGSAISSVAQGRSLGNTLLRAGIAGGTSALGSELSGGLGAGAGSAAGQTAGSQVGSAVASNLASNVAQGAVDDIIVNAIINRGLSPVATSLLSSAAGSALGSAASSLAKAPQVPEAYTPPPENIILTAQPTTSAVGGNNLISSVAGSGLSNVPTGGGTNPVTGEQNDINVTAQPNAGVLNGLPSSIASGAAQTTLPEVGPIDTVEEPGFLEKVKSALRPSDYLKLAALLPGLFGGGGGGSGATYTGAGTALNPRFSAKLPSPTLPGASSNFAARPAAEIGTVNGEPRDWTKYGFGPEASFFSYVPQRGYAHGGEAHGDGPDRSFAVQGPGDGRSDEIPAMLSDGEYVMDAETVALLGNGSPKAGAQVLDEFRVNVRKHKGQKLAKGEFSVNAKKPERYLAGGRI